MKIAKLLVVFMLFMTFLTNLQMAASALQNDESFPSYLGRGWINDVILSPQEDRLLVQTWLSLYLYAFPSMELLATAELPPQTELVNESVLFSESGDYLIIPVAPPNINHYGRLQLLDAYTLEPKVPGLVWNSPQIVSPDGKLVIYKDEESNAPKVLNAMNGNEIATLDTFLHETQFSPDSRLLANNNQSIELWDMTTLTMVATMSGSSYAFSPDMRWFATSGEDETAITLWRVDTLTAEATIPQSATELAFSSDSQTLITSSNEKITLWGMTTLSEVASETAERLAFSPPFILSPQETLLIMQRGDNSISLWDLETRQQLATLSIDDFKFSRQMQFLVVDRVDGIVSVWNLANNSEIQVQAESFFDFSPDEQILMTADENMNIHLWNVATGSEIGVLSGHEERMETIQFSAPYILSSSRNISILWDFDPAAQHLTQRQKMDRVYHEFYASPDGQLVVNNRGIMNLATGQQVLEADAYEVLPNWDKALVYYRREDATGTRFSSVHLWDLESGEEIASFEEPQNNIPRFFTKDRTMLITVGNGHLRLWDLEAPEDIVLVEDYTSAIADVVFSLDSRTVFAGESDGSVSQWDIRTGEKLRSWEGHDRAVQALALSPNGSILASGAEDTRIKLWDAARGEEIMTLTGHTRPITDLEFSPDGHLLASAGDDTLFLWDVDSGTSLVRLGGRTTQIAFSPDGQTIASVGGDQIITLWNLASRERLATLTGHTAVATSLAFNSDGQILASGDADGNIKLWDVDGLRELGNTEELKREGTISRLMFSPNGGVLMILSTTPGSFSYLNGEISMWGTVENLTLQGYQHYGMTNTVFSSQNMLLATSSSGGIVHLDSVYDYDEYHTPVAKVSETLLCRGYVEPRLTIGSIGQVLPGEDNSLNSVPSRASLGESSRVGFIPAGATFTVLDGPVCGDGGILWWQVDYNGLIGWTGEGQGSDTYWVAAFDPNVAIATPIPTLAPVATSEPLAQPEAIQCPRTAAHRLVIGRQGRVLPGDANLINSNPARLSEDPTNQELGRIPGGEIFNVLAGPVCNGDIAWWQVEYDGIIGWTGEGQGDVYWVESVE